MCVCVCAFVQAVPTLTPVPSSANIGYYLWISLKLEISGRGVGGTNERQ